MKLKKPGLLSKIVVAIVIGVVVGMFLPDNAIRGLNTFRDIFGQLIKFFVPLIVIGFVTPAIAETGRAAGRSLLITMAIAFVSTIFAGYYSFFMGSTVMSFFVHAADTSAISAGKEFPSYFHIGIPPLADILTSLVFAFIVGLGIVHSNCRKLLDVFCEFRDIVSFGIAKVIVPFLPVYVLSVVADITACGKLASIAGPSIRIILCCFAFTTLLLFIQYAIVGMLVRRNPFKALWNMMPAYLTGWGCCSSAATIPVTLRQTIANGVSRETADLVIPLCSSVHLAGSMCNMVAYAIGIVFLYGDVVSLSAFTEYIFMLSVIAIASPGVPGGMVLASAAIVEGALGFSPERYALMVALYMSLDGMGTACNLTGDGAIAMLVDHWRSDH